MKLIETITITRVITIEITTRMDNLRTNAKYMVDMSGKIADKTQQTKATTEITAITAETGMKIATIAGAAEVDPGHVRILLDMKRVIETIADPEHEATQEATVDTSRT